MISPVRIFPLILSFALLFPCPNAFAVDVLDAFKFDCERREELQSGKGPFDPARSCGIVSPLTEYLCQVAGQILSKKQLPDLWERKLEELKPGENFIDYIAPEETVEISDDVQRRNYTGAQFFFKSPASLEAVLRVFNARKDYKNFIPGMESSALLAQQDNRYDAETVRKTSASVFGVRESRYRTADISASLDLGKKVIVRVQLLKDPDGQSPSLIFYDSLWYFESTGEGCRGFYLTFTLLPWDYLKTPSFFPLLSGEVRRQVVRRSLDGVSETVLAFLAVAEDPHFEGKSPGDFTAADKKAVGENIKKRIRAMRQERKSLLQIPWKNFLGYRK